MSRRECDEAALEAEIAPLPDLSHAELRARWKLLFGRPAPKSLRRKFMARAVAYQMQVAAYGGLSAATRRRLREIAMAVRNGDRNSVLGGVQIKPGTQLIRQWQNTTHTVTVLDDGFALDGRTYKSLSAVAKGITGTNWNGYAFFGIKRAARGNKGAAGSKRDSRLINHLDPGAEAPVLSRSSNDGDSRA
jgi:Protein of unknown function (DUF2924)